MFSFSKLVFPKPRCSYSKVSFQADNCELIFVPVKNEKRNVPCLHISDPDYSRYILYFHGNAEDL